MRIYLPTTLPALAALSGHGFAAPLTAFAVSAARLADAPDGDLEELEHAALLAAARHSLGLLTGGSGPWRRVVVAADLPDAAVRAVLPGPDGGPVADGVVVVEVPVPRAAVASIHVDDDAARAAVRAAASGAGPAGSAPDAMADHHLLWYDAGELDDVRALD